MFSRIKMSLPYSKKLWCLLIAAKSLSDSNTNSPLLINISHAKRWPWILLFPIVLVMALVNRLHSMSSSLFLPHFRKPNTWNSKPICSLNFTSSSSPFTEKNSIERYQRDQWLFKDRIKQTTSCSTVPDFDSIRENDIALQLPELKKLLQVLREKRENECGSSDGAEKCGPGNVFLVGTGPGDPELLTLKAVRVIQSADLLLYDRLVSNDVLDLIGPNARLLYVGKTAGYHSRTQVLSLSVKHFSTIGMPNLLRCFPFDFQSEFWYGFAR